jgi:hypothetical protein
MLKDTNFLINSLKNFQNKIILENHFQNKLIDDLYQFFEDTRMIFMFDFYDIIDFIDDVEIPF